ncbi:MAG: hydrogen gas-evolving membrane-bound hydrogenase subunit E [Thermoplasmata archaeon]
MKDSLKKRLFTVFLVFLSLTIILTSLNLDHNNKAQTEVSEFYRENVKETGANSLIESILLGYRAYDTFGEVMVLYIAIAGVLILGRNIKGGEKE